MAQANRIDHERVSIDALVQYLKQRCSHQNVEIQKELNDPPDFWLSIDGNRFAVEETSITSEDTVKGIAVARRQGRNSGSLGCKWEGEVQNELAELIQKAVRAKREKLERKGVPQQCRDIILLLYDAHAFGDAQDAKIALETVEGYDWFHSIFWAKVGWLGPNGKDPSNELYPEEPGRIGFFLYTKEARWRK